jgi:predicted NAD/FAD-binding protein
MTKNVTEKIAGKIAIVGSGIAGLGCAWLLNQKYDITVFEQNNKVGGHANTVNIIYPANAGLEQKNIAVDTGFIVYNFRTYHHLKNLFRLLKVEICESQMSFGIKDYSLGLEYVGSSLSGMFAQKKNILDVNYWLMIRDIIKFNKAATKLIEKKAAISAQITLEEFISQLNLGKYFREYYLFPMASAIWSCPVAAMKFYPAQTFLQFFYNHGLLSVNNQPQWYAVKDGSQQYITKLTRDFAHKIKTDNKIISCQKIGDTLILENAKGSKYQFDHVIFASHANQTYNIIADKTPAEEAILSKFKYSTNLAVLHRDIKQMPQNKKAWASWVYLSKKGNNKASLTYWMNNLQKIDRQYPLFVTLNPLQEIDPDKIFAKFNYSHPIFDFEAIKAQNIMEEIQGKRNIWFAGAWLKYGFHEDGIDSAVRLANIFNIAAPW